jgi:hypothetical protein
MHARLMPKHSWRAGLTLMPEWRAGMAAVALFLAVPALAATAPSAPLPEQAGDAIPDVAVQRAVRDASYAFFAAKDAGRDDVAYAFFAASVRTYLSADLFRSQTDAFNAMAGRGGERRVVRLTWERDPPDAPAPGLYVAADFVARFPNLRLHCGYLMWHREADGRFRIVREEQSFIDEATARQMVPERLRPLPAQFGCVGAAAALE